MFNKEKHQLIMGRILRDIYSDVSLAPLLGFKGGTCAYFFYDLPRFSVDLDFDLFDTRKTTQTTIFKKLLKILTAYGKIKDQCIKKWTIFALLSYGDGERNIKIEISTRDLIADLKKHYTLKEHLGISMMVAQKSTLFAAKLAALTLRRETAARDIYDLCYFAKNNWDIDHEILQKLTGKKTKDHLADCIAVIEKIKDSQILQGLGELVSEKEKAQIKKNLKTDAIFMLKNYQLALAR